MTVTNTTTRREAREFQEKFIGTGLAPETREEAMRLARHMTAEEGQSALDDALGLAASWCEVNGITGKTYPLVPSRR